MTDKKTCQWKWLLIAMICMVSGCSYLDTRRSIDFVVPKGYVGWIRVKYNVFGTQPLPIRNGRYAARIPANGLLKTSTLEEEGWGRDQFYFINKSGQETHLPSDFDEPNRLMWGPAGRTNETWMFIGTKKQFADAQRLIGGQDPGPIKLP